MTEICVECLPEDIQTKSDVYDLIKNKLQIGTPIGIDIINIAPPIWTNLMGKGFSIRSAMVELFWFDTPHALQYNRNIKNSTTVMDCVYGKHTRYLSIRCINNGNIPRFDMTHYLTEENKSLMKRIAELECEVESLKTRKRDKNIDASEHDLISSAPLEFSI
jgi:hypothetical protein